MRDRLFENQKDALIWFARTLLMLLFLVFGWDKLADFSGTVTYMASTGVPTPTIATIIFVTGAKAATTVCQNAINKSNLEKLKDLACLGVEKMWAALPSVKQG